ncbi:MAG: tyrosine--tRNA ligase, partial [Candidatus Parcubacteria bacterium]|nr:tyrosine--tRNA ligase [Candidatus Parcubacteria bacterium]
DQTFNMLAGRNLMKDLKNKEKFVLTTKLLTDSGGQKMGKTEGNMVALSASAQDIFGGVMSWSDELIDAGFLLCTRLSVSEMNEIKYKFNNPRDQKARLAFEITKMYHGEAMAQKAQQEFDKIFRQKEIPTDIPHYKLQAANYKLVDLLVETKLAPSKSEARRLIEQKAVKINGEVLIDWQKEIKIVSGVTIQVGPRRFVQIDTRA